MASPGHSALPQELLLEVEPRRPGEERQVSSGRAHSPLRGSRGAGADATAGRGAVVRAVGRWARGLLTPVVVVGGHERAAGGDGCHAPAWGLPGTCANGGDRCRWGGALPSRPRGPSGGAATPGLFTEPGRSPRSHGPPWARRARAAPTSLNRPRGRNKGALCARPPPADPGTSRAPRGQRGQRAPGATNPPRAALSPPSSRPRVRPAAGVTEWPRARSTPLARRRLSPRRRPLAGLGARSRGAGAGALGHGTHLRSRPREAAPRPRRAHARTRPLIWRGRARHGGGESRPRPGRVAPPRARPRPSARLRRTHSDGSPASQRRSAWEARPGLAWGDWSR